MAFLEAKETHGKELEEILLEVVEPTRREPGNIAYVLHRSNDNPDELVIMFPIGFHNLTVMLYEYYLSSN